MSDTSNIIKVTNLVQRSLDQLSAANQSDNPQTAARHMQSARIYADLSESQGTKTANIIAYLNSDRGRWSEDDEAVVRSMLGLHPLNAGPDNGGVPDEEPDTDPVPTPEVEQTVPAPAPTHEPELALATAGGEPDFD